VDDEVHTGLGGPADRDGARHQPLRGGQPAALSGVQPAGTRTTLEDTQYPNRDAQFRYLNSLTESFLATGDPVISVDTKNKAIPYGVYDASVFAVATIKE
jgi:Rhodopirellula transposase DDE domain